MSTATGIRSWPLVGRETELATIERLLEDDGSASVVIAGEAGVGKTRLAREAVAIAERLQRPIRWVGGVRAAAEIPFGAFAQLLPPPDPGWAGPADYMRAAVRELAGTDGGDRVLIVVDDAHALDSWSAALVHQLVATSSAAIVATVRHGEASPDAITALWKDELAAYVEVRALSEIEVAELLPVALGGDVDGATVRDLFAATRGNPLFLRVIVSEGLAQGALDQSGGVWRWSGPVTGGGRLLEIIGQSLGRLDEEELDALLIVALGEPLGAHVLTALVDSAALDSIQRRGLVAVGHAGRRIEVGLVHPLYGELATARVPQLRVAAARRSLAEASEAIGMRRRDDVLRVATWRLDAGAPGDGRLMLRGAQRARAMHDPALAERLARAADGAGAGAMAHAFLAEAVLAQGRFEEAVELLRDPDLETTNDRERSIVASALGNALFFGLGRAEDADAVALAAERTIVDPDLRDELRSFRGAIRLFTGRPLEALVITEPVLERPGLGTGCAIRAAITALPAGAISGRTDRALKVADQWRGAAEQIEAHLPFARAQFFSTRALCLMFAGELAEAVSECERYYRDSVERRAQYASALWAYMLGRALLAQGRVHTAQRWLREAAVLMREQDESGLLVVVLASLAQALALSGATGEAQSAVTEAIAARRPAEHLFDPDVGLAEVWIAASRGELSSARQRALEVARRAAGAGMHAAAAVVFHDVARLGDPARVVDRLAELAKEVDGRLAPAYAASARALQARDGEALDRVAAQFESIGAMLLAAEAASQAAVKHLATGDRSRGLSAGARASLLATRCEGATTPGLAATAPAALLTVREREIAMLAAAGHTSSAIAETLVLSRRTVESHLYNAYRKLGVSDRAQLAAALGLPETATAQ